MGRFHPHWDLFCHLQAEAASSYSLSFQPALQTSEGKSVWRGNHLNIAFAAIEKGNRSARFTEDPAGGLGC